MEDDWGGYFDEFFDEDYSGGDTYDVSANDPYAPYYDDTGYADDGYTPTTDFSSYLIGDDQRLTEYDGYEQLPGREENYGLTNYDSSRWFDNYYGRTSGGGGGGGRGSSGSLGRQPNSGGPQPRQPQRRPPSSQLFQIGDRRPYPSVQDRLNPLYSTTPRGVYDPGYAISDPYYQMAGAPVFAGAPGGGSPSANMAPVILVAVAAVAAIVLLK